jgi:hypothetical protein
MSRIHGHNTTINHRSRTTWGRRSQSTISAAQCRRRLRRACRSRSPQLPKWLPDVTLRGLAVGKARLDLRVWRDDERT